MAMLYARDTGRRAGGGGVAVSLFDTMMDVMGYQLTYTQHSGIDQQPLGMSSPAVAPYGSYDTADGQLMMVAGSDIEFRGVCRAFGQEEMADEARYATIADRMAHIAELIEWQTRELARRAVDEVVALLDRGVVPVINQNDAVTFNELIVGDNDKLSATIVNLVGADLLVILTEWNEFRALDLRALAKTMNDPRLFVVVCIALGMLRHDLSEGEHDERQVGQLRLAVVLAGIQHLTKLFELGHIDFFEKREVRYRGLALDHLLCDLASKADDLHLCNPGSAGGERSRCCTGHGSSGCDERIQVSVPDSTGRATPTNRV